MFIFIPYLGLSWIFLISFLLLLLLLNAGSSRRLLPFDQDKRMKVNKGGGVEMAGIINTKSGIRSPFPFLKNGRTLQ